MKLKRLGLFAVPIVLALTLTGCNYIDKGIEEVKSIGVDPNVGPNLTKGKVVETAKGSYTKVRVSDDYMNALFEASDPDPDAVMRNMDPEGNGLVVTPGEAKATFAKYYFSYFIDSLALEGGDKALKKFIANATKQQILADTEFTQKGLAKPGVFPVLTKKRIINVEDPEPFIHDGKPRVSDATLEFGADDTFRWNDSKDGVVISGNATWTVDYRITDETVFDMMRNSLPKKSDDEVREMLKDEAKDGKGENVMRVRGTSDFDVLLTSGEAQIYAHDNTVKTQLPFVVKPEFENEPPAEEAPEK